MGDLIGTHGRVADEDQLIVMAIFVQDIPGVGAFRKAAAIVLPHAFIGAIVEIEKFEILELRGRGAEQLFAQLDEGIHRAANIEKQQQFNRIVPFGPHVDIQPALFGGAIDCPVYIQLVRGAFAGEFAQTAQGNLDVAGAQQLAVVEILELALVPDLDRLSLAAFAANADAFGIIAGITVGRGTTGADPLAAAFVPLFLFRETLFQRLHDFVPAAERLDLLHFLFGQIFLRDCLQPVERDVFFLHAVAGLDALEDFRKNLVEAIEQAFVLHEGGAGEIVKFFRIAADNVLFQRLEQDQMFLERGGDAGGPELVHEVEEHRPDPCLARFALRHECQPFEEHHVLFVLQQRAVQGRDGLAGILGLQHVERHVFVENQFQPVEQFAGAWLFLKAGHVPDIIENVHCPFDQNALNVREMDVDNFLHGLAVGEFDIVEETTAQECVGQFLLVVGSDDNDWPLCCLDRLFRFVDMEFHAVEFLQ